MLTIFEVLAATLFNAVLPIFIVSTMFALGLGTVLSEFIVMFRNITLVALVLVINLILVPLIGWGTAAAMALSLPAYVALVLVASSPGSPFIVRPAVLQNGNAITGSSLQALLAVIGSITFALTANGIFLASKLGGGLTLPVVDVIKAVAVLQILPFLIGMALRYWTEETALQWRLPAYQVSLISFIVVLGLSFLGSWQIIASLAWSFTLLAAIIFTIISFGIGALLTPGSSGTRASTGLLATMRNAGPVYAAIAIGLGDSPSVLGAATAILLMQLVLAIPFAAYLSARRSRVAEVPPSPEQNIDEQAI